MPFNKDIANPCIRRFNAADNHAKQLRKDIERELADLKERTVQTSDDVDRKSYLVKLSNGVIKDGLTCLRMARAAIDENLFDQANQLIVQAERKFPLSISPYQQTEKLNDDTDTSDEAPAFQPTTQQKASASAESDTPAAAKKVDVERKTPARDVSDRDGWEGFSNAEIAQAIGFALKWARRSESTTRWVDSKRGTGFGRPPEKKHSRTSNPEVSETATSTN